MMIEKKLLDNVKHAALATANSDGTPHNSPLFFAFDDSFKKIYFASLPTALHSINFLRTRKGFLVIYNSHEFEGGIYVTLNNGRIAEGKELEEALSVYRKRLKKFDNTALSPDFYKAENGYRLFIGNVVKIEIYHSVEDDEGYLKKEYRKRISAEELSDV